MNEFKKQGPRASLAIFGLAIFTTLVVGCSKNEPQKTSSPATEQAASRPASKDEIYFGNLSLEIDSEKPEKISTEEGTLAQAIADKKAFSHEKLNELLIRQHDLRWAKNHASEFALRDQIQKIAKPLSELNPISELKVAYESKIDEIVQKTFSKKTQYNKRAVNLHNIFEEGLQQCYSGTILHLAMARASRTGADYTALNPVVILQSAHVLPGYILEKQGRFHLYAIETTQSGGAAKYLGDTENLNSTARRIFDANQYVAVELLKKYIKNKPEALQQMLAYTAERYKIPFKRLEQSIPVSDSPVEAGEDSELNASFLNFGEDTTPEGTTDRVETANDFPKGFDPKEFAAPARAIDPISNGTVQILPTPHNRTTFDCSYQGGTFFRNAVQQAHLNAMQHNDQQFLQSEWKLNSQVPAGISTVVELEEIAMRAPDFRICCMNGFARSKAKSDYETESFTYHGEYRGWSNQGGAIYSSETIEIGMRMGACFPQNHVFLK